jgi:hypothetical protein
LFGELSPGVALVMRVDHAIDTHPLSSQAAAELGYVTAAKLGHATEIENCGH